VEVNPLMFRQVIIPLDGSALAECSLPHAVAFARAFGAPIVLLRVVVPPVQEGIRRAAAPFRWQLRKAEAAAYLGQTAKRLTDLGLEVSSELDEGDAAERILGFTGEQGDVLLVMSSHGASGLSEWNISSVVQKVVFHAYTPTLIVRAYRSNPVDLVDLRYDRILVPIDGSRRAELALPYAATLAEAHDSTLLLTSVVGQPKTPGRLPLTESERSVLDRLMESTREDAADYLRHLTQHFSGNVETRVLLDEDVAYALHTYAEQTEADLVVLSAHGHTGASRWPFGSVALNFIAFGTTPLLIVQDVAPPDTATTVSVRAAERPKQH